MSAHTPGPWRVHKRDDCIVMGSGSNRVAVADLPDDARLIAAAPAMLEALQGLYDVVDEGGVAVGKALDKARAAIALAKGVRAAKGGDDK